MRSVSSACVALCLVCILGSAFAQPSAPDPIVSMTEAGSGGWAWALSESGNLFRWPGEGVSEQWGFICNIPEQAGVPGQYTFVSLREWGVLLPIALTSSGQYFMLSPAQEWLNLGYVTDTAGVPAEGSFVALSTVAGRRAAITESGQVYVTQEGSSEPVWQYFGSIEADTGVVPDTGSSIGDLKSMFR